MALRDAYATVVGVDIAPKPAALAAPCPLSGKKKLFFFVRGRVQVERTALGIAGGQSKVVEAVQDEASPTPLPGEPPKAKNLLLGEGQSLLRAHFKKLKSLATATRAMDVHIL